jgi:cytochrome c
MRSRRPLAFAVACLLGGAALAQAQTYGVGRTPTPDEIRKWDIGISPDGKELPQGHGTAVEGAVVYRQKGCAGCHGASLTGGRAPVLVKADKPAGTDPWELGRVLPFRAPFATVVWDFINRGMPLNREGTLTPDEVYALTAFLLFKNGVIREDEIMDAQTLPRVKMPMRENFAPIPEWKHGAPRLKGYPY